MRGNDEGGREGERNEGMEEKKEGERERRGGEEGDERAHLYTSGSFFQT